MSTTTQGQMDFVQKQTTGGQAAVIAGGVLAATAQCSMPSGGHYNHPSETFGAKSSPSSEWLVSGGYVTPIQRPITPGRGLPFVQRMEVRRSPVPSIRFVATPPTGGAQRPTANTTSAPCVRLGPMTPTFTSIRFIPSPSTASAQSTTPPGLHRPLGVAVSCQDRASQNLSAQEVPLINQGELETGGSSNEELIAALDRHTAALERHAAALDRHTAAIRQQTPDSVSGPCGAGR